MTDQATGLPIEPVTNTDRGIAATIMFIVVGPYVVGLLLAVFEELKKL